MTSYPITICIPAYNAAQSIERAVKSALDQLNAAGKPLTQVLVVDDGSTDETAALVASIARAQNDPARVQLIKHDQNKGRFIARKTALEHIDTPFMLFLDADDEYLPGCAARLLEAQADSFDIVQCSMDLRYSGQVAPSDKAFAEAFCRAPEAETYGDDITHLVFRDRQTTWSLCGKLMRSILVQDAFSQLPDETINLGEDLCAFFVISCLAQSYCGLGGYAGYVYNIDAGGSGALRKQFDLRQFLDQCIIIMPLHLMLSYLIRTQRADALMPDYLTVRREHVRAIADKLLNHMDASLQPQAFDEFANLWPIEEVVAALAEVGWEKPADVFDAIAGAARLQCPAASDGKLHTVALYNHRMGVGGAEQVSADLAVLWHSLGYRVVFLCDTPRDECAYDLPQDVIWVQLPATDSITSQSYIERADAISQAVRKYQVDALVHQQWYSPLLAWDLMLLKALGVPTSVFVHSFHGTLFFVGNAHEFDASRVLRHADALIVLSESDGEFWKRFNPRVFVTNNRSTIAPGSVERAKLTSKNVVWVGRLTPFDKQPEEAIEIMAKVADADATLTLVGPARWQSELVGLQNLAKARGLAERVVFAGAVDDVTPFLQNASVFLMTSRIEGYPLALSEAMAVGLPCVMYELDYLTLVQGNEGIAAVPQGNRDAAARAITELLHSDDERRCMGDAAFARLSELEAFDYEALWKSVFAVLAKGSVPREDYSSVDAQWDQLVNSMKMGVEWVSKPDLGVALKDALYQAARRTWHRAKPLLDSMRGSANE